jgi:hypothetical protein
MNLISQFPNLSEILSNVYTPWNNLYWGTWPPNQAVMQWGWTRFDLWSNKAQARFNQLWPTDGDDWVDSLIELYGSSWHNALPFLAVRDQSEFLSRLESACKGREITIPGIYSANNRVTVEVALEHGPWVRTVKRRKWDFPSPNYCSICGAGYYVDTVNYLLRKWGPTNTCPRCMYIASYGIPTTSPMYKKHSLKAALKYLQDLSSIVQVIPPQSFRETFPNPGFDPSVRDRILAALICIPNANVIRKLAGGVPWLKILQLAGLVGDACRLSRGTFCTAIDGHPCRSLAERSIDDWLTSRGINHQIEPYYPKNDELNPLGKFRADWRLHDGTFVEYGGLDSKDYLLRIETKRMLAAIAGLTLIIIFPEDLHRLEAIFHRWIK